MGDMFLCIGGGVDDFYVVLGWSNKIKISS